jgi:predicted tellurium resistance membrane protein TerC
MLAALLQVCLTNLLLSSDNVLMIALMSEGVRRLRRAYALLASLLASVAVQLGVLFVVAFLFRIPLLQSVFGVVICLMAFRLTGRRHAHAGPAKALGFGPAVLRITTGNLMMSFENEAALITLAQGNVWLAWAGMLATAPLVFFGSHLVASVLNRHAVIVYVGAVYLFSVGARLLLSTLSLGPYAAGAAWLLTALFAAYAAALYLRRRVPAGSGSGGVA